MTTYLRQIKCYCVVIEYKRSKQQDKGAEGDGVDRADKPVQSQAGSTGKEGRERRPEIRDSDHLQLDKSG